MTDRQRRRPWSLPGPAEVVGRSRAAAWSAARRATTPTAAPAGGSWTRRTARRLGRPATTRWRRSAPTVRYVVGHPSTATALGAATVARAGRRAPARSSPCSARPPGRRSSADPAWEDDRHAARPTSYARRPVERAAALDVGGTRPRASARSAATAARARPVRRPAVTDARAAPAGHDQDGGDRHARSRRAGRGPRRGARGRPARSRARRPSRRCRCTARAAAPAPGCRAWRRTLLGQHPQPRVGRHPAADQDVLDALVARRVDRLAGEHVADRLLEGRGHVGHRHRLAGALPGLDPAGHRGLQPGEGEVEPVPLAGRGREVRPRGKSIATGCPSGPPGRCAGRRGTAARAAGRPCRTPPPPRRRWWRPSGVDARG